MKRKFFTPLNIPAPREPINQGIDENNVLVQEHNATYNRLLSSVTSENTLDKALVALDPFGTAPLSLYLGVWGDAEDELTISVVDTLRTTYPITYQYPLEQGRNLVPASGLVAGVMNDVVLTTTLQESFRYQIGFVE